MRSHAPRQHGIGIDFGTTHSALAWAGPAGPAEVVSFSLFDEPIQTFRSILYFENDCAWVRGRPEAHVGPEAIERYLDNDGEGRLMQSMKTFLASKQLGGTNVFGYEYALERLIARILEGLWRGAEDELVARGARVLGDQPPVVVGRPVRFAGSDGEDGDTFAEGRLRAAFAAAGFTDIELVLEPVAAALHYESTLTRDETVLVADFGGGTSDFSLLRAGPSHRDDPTARSRILGATGVGVAGDDLDARIVQHLVAPGLGQGSRYRSMLGEELEIPRGIFDKLRRWNELSILRTRKNMDMLNGYLRAALEPDKLSALIHLVENNLGYRLYRAVEAAKVTLSSAHEAELVFADEEHVLRERFTRADFESWISPELAALGRCVDDLLDHAGLAPEAVDTVFLTGGTGQVPAVRRLFAERFGEGRLRAGAYLTSIASGLAVHARAVATAR